MFFVCEKRAQLVETKAGGQAVREEGGKRNDISFDHATGPNSTSAPNASSSLARPPLPRPGRQSGRLPRRPLPASGHRAG